MASRPRRLGLAALVLALALLPGCGDDGPTDVSDAKFRRDFLEASGGLRADIANCVVDELLAKLDQDAINDFYGEEGTPLSASNQKVQDDAVRRCTTESIATSTTTTAPG